MSLCRWWLNGWWNDIHSKRIWLNLHLICMCIFSFRFYFLFYSLFLLLLLLLNHWSVGVWAFFLIYFCIHRISSLNVNCKISTRKLRNYVFFPSFIIHLSWISCSCRKNRQKNKSIQFNRIMPIQITLISRIKLSKEK